MVEFRSAIERFDEWLRAPYRELTPHLLQNLTSHSYSYVLLSKSGKALLLDYGYDAMPDLPAGTDRASRRPWLYSLPWLKRDYGVDKIDVVIPTHYHDDHVAGFNLLRDVEGTQVWAPDNFSDVLERPTRYDLPCLWYEPIGVDRKLPTGGTVRWEEYDLRIDALPGHTQFAAAISFTVDGTRVVATGDQQDKQWARDAQPGSRLHERLNHVYAGRVQPDDFVKSAALYARLDPELMISGHWRPRKIEPDYLEMLASRGQLFEELHRELLPLEEVDLGLEGFAARIEPYRSSVAPGGRLDVDVWVRNPFPEPREARIELVVPREWTVDPAERCVPLDARAQATVAFALQVGNAPTYRARIAADVTVGEDRLGQQAEALVTIRS